MQREKQSKALGAAFLAHQVQQLESRVDHLSFSRDHYRSTGGSSRGGGRGRGGARGGGASNSSQRPDQPRKDKEIRIVDASVLVHALPLLKKWVREDRYQFIVPLSGQFSLSSPLLPLILPKLTRIDTALSTLDILKKSPQPLHDLAREATRFLETQFNIARQISSSSSSLSPDSSRIRLRAQASNEELPWSKVEELFTVPEGFEPSLPFDSDGIPLELPIQEDGSPIPIPLPTASDIHRPLRSTLQCILHFSALSPTSSVLLYNSSLPMNPPIPASFLSILPTQPRQAQPPIDFLALSSGDQIYYYLKTFFKSRGGGKRVVSDEEVEKAREWWKVQAEKQKREKERLNDGQNERGRGGSRGGKSRGTGEGGGGVKSQKGTAKTLFVP